MLLVKIGKIKNFLDKNLLNIFFLLIIFSASKNFIYSFNYVRGVLIDYSLFKITLAHFLLLLLIPLYFKNIKKHFKLLIFVMLFILINIIFSLNPIFTIAYCFNFFPLFLLTLILFDLKNELSYKLLILVNFFYIIIFIIQFLFRQSLFPYFPFGFYPYIGVGANLDFFSFFGEKYVLPLGNFPHSNVFAAFLCFLTIFHFKNKQYFLVVINTILILLLSSLASIIFLIFLSLFYSKTKFNAVYSLLFLPLIYVFYIYGFKEVSVLERFNQLKIFSFSISNYPLFGVGVNNFINVVNLFENIDKRIYVLQPIHNILLLIFAEYGLFVFVFLVSLLIYFRKFVLKFTPFILFIIVFGMFDHFLITLYQGLLLLALTIILHKSIINTNSHV